MKHEAPPGSDKPAPSMDHSMMDNERMAMPMSPSSPREPIPPITEADREAAFPAVAGHSVHDNLIQNYVLFNRLEAWDADPGSGLRWEGQGWIGTDRNRVWVRSEGTREDDTTHDASLEVLYGRSISRWWDVVAGVRQDVDPGSSQTFAGIGVVGLAPYWFEVETTVYIGEAGQTAARLEVEYEILLTNRLILQPLIEMNLFGEDDARRGIGSGLSTVEAGLRLRYEFTRRFAPYLGLVYERAVGDTADFRRARGIDPDDTRVVAGIRVWF
jgi:copper resistance protein B